MKLNSKMRSLILTICGVLSVGVAEQLPPYIRKCSLEDPDIGNCIITNGNLAIPELIKGSSFFGIPPAIPLRVSSINLPGTDFTAILSNVQLFGLENVRIKAVSFDGHAIRGEILMTVPYVNLTADYVILTNDFFFPQTVEFGKLHTDLAENSFKYTGKANVFARSGVPYLNYADDDLIFKSKRISYRYNDLHASRTAFSNPDYLNFHKRIIDERITAGISTILHKYVTTIAHNMVNKAPKEAIFDD